MACNHDNVDGSVTMVRSAHDPPHLRVDVKIKCEDCGVQFQFGEAFVSSTDGLELTAIVAPGPREKNKPLTATAVAILNGF